MRGLPGPLAKLRTGSMLVAVILAAATAAAIPVNTTLAADRPATWDEAVDETACDDDAACRGDDDGDDDGPGIAEYDILPPNTVWRRSIGLDAIGDRYDGEGVTVAVIDTGVSRVTDLDGRVRARVDLTPDRDGYDRYGHGTHMMGLVAGNGAGSGGRWSGVAPGADIVSVKVAGWDGATDVSVIIAAIQWVVSHRDEYGIRVLNLSFGTDSSQAYQLDPLDRAVERAWEAGILVVMSAGNRGPDGTISKPSDDPHVLTVGASDVRGTPGVTDDRVAPFSSRGPTADGVPKPDLVAPGITLVATRAAGSTIDTFRSEARIEAGYFKGTGTSQAAAIVSGVAALLFQADPSLTPDAAKAALTGTTRGLHGHSGAGAGQIDAAAAIASVERTTGSSGAAGRVFPPGTGLGSIDASRGSHRVFTDQDGDGRPEQLAGEVDALGDPFQGGTWAATPWTAETWASTRWASVMCVGAGWSAPSCGPDTWLGMAWDARWWGSRTWSEAGWDQKSWTNKSWTQKSWTTGHWN